MSENMNKTKKEILVVVAIVAICVLVILFGSRSVNVQQAYGMTITNQQLAQAHLLPSITNTTSTSISTTTTILQNPSPYTSHTIKSG